MFGVTYFTLVVHVVLCARVRIHRAYAYVQDPRRREREERVRKRTGRSLVSIARSLRRRRNILQPNVHVSNILMHTCLRKTSRKCVRMHSRLCTCGREAANLQLAERQY